MQASVEAPFTTKAACGRLQDICAQLSLLVGRLEGISSAVDGATPPPVPNNSGQKSGPYPEALNPVLDMGTQIALEHLGRMTDIVRRIESRLGFAVDVPAQRAGS